MDRNKKGDFKVQQDEMGTGKNAKSWTAVDHLLEMGEK